MLGCGTVGAAAARMLAANAEDIAARTGVRLEVTRIAVRDLARDRDVPQPPAVVTTDGVAIVDDPDVDVVVELLGGIEPAKQLLLRALANGKRVVTGNKELLANEGRELFEAADAAGLDLLFEA